MKSFKKKSRTFGLRPLRSHPAFPTLTASRSLPGAGQSRRA
jgi:hypothetical protein